MRVKLLAKDGSEWVEEAEILFNEIRFDYYGTAMLLTGIEVEIDGEWYKKPLFIHNRVVSNDHPFAIISGYEFHLSRDEIL